jgi:hypothetical protein
MARQVGQSTKNASIGLFLISLCLLAPTIAQAATKWTFLLYLLADNDLECFALINMLVGHPNSCMDRPS